jgi:HD-like signal output (HDOD) protein
MSLEELESNALKKISKSIEDNSLVLPRVPEVVKKIDAAINNSHTSMREIGEIIKYESSISARILQIANSPLVRGNTNINSLQSAITRIGLEMVRNLVLCMGVRDSFIVNRYALRKKMKELWDDNIAIAMYAYFLARHLGMNADFAMMAGMLHSLGKLPIINYASEHHEILDDSRVFDYLIKTLHKPLGIKILRKWEFQDELVSVVENYDEIDKSRPGEVDHVDVVIVSYSFRNDSHETPMDWYRVKALRKMGISRDELGRILNPVSGEVSEIAGILFS